MLFHGAAGTVAVLLPVELATGFLRRGAEWLVSVLPLNGTDASFNSPVKTAVAWAAGGVQAFLERGLGLNGGWLATLMLAIGLATIIGAFTAGVILHDGYFHHWGDEGKQSLSIKDLIASSTRFLVVLLLILEDSESSLRK